MNIRTVLVFSAAIVVCSAKAHSVQAPATHDFTSQTQVAFQQEPDEEPPVDEETLEDMFGQCPVYPACPPGF